MQVEPVATCLECQGQLTIVGRRVRCTGCGIKSYLVSCVVDGKTIVVRARLAPKPTETEDDMKKTKKGKKKKPMY